jgi:hypothetical protein
MDQHKTEMQVGILALNFLSTLFNQLPTILVIVVGGGILKMKLVIRQIILTKGHERNRCRSLHSVAEAKLLTPILIPFGEIIFC